MIAEVVALSLAYACVYGFQSQAPSVGDLDPTLYTVSCEPHYVALCLKCESHDHLRSYS